MAPPPPLFPPIDRTRTSTRHLHVHLTRRRWTGVQGLKAACHRFQVAAGVFQYIRERVVGGLVGTLTQDLIPDGLSAASGLMLAQVPGYIVTSYTVVR